MIVNVEPGKTAAIQGVTIVAAPYRPSSMLVATSITPNTIPEGLAALPPNERYFTFVLDQYNLGFEDGMRLRVSALGSPEHWMEGVVAVFDTFANELTLIVDLTSGYGTFQGWSISQAGQQGQIGPMGPQGPRGPRGDYGGPQGPVGEMGVPGDKGTMIYGTFPTMEELVDTLPNGPATGDLGEAYIVGDNDLAVWDRYAVRWRIVANIGGPQGEKGDPGTDEGPQGPQGPLGPEGPVGPQGATGPQGSPGPTPSSSQITTALAAAGIDVERYLSRDGIRSFTGFGRTPSPAAGANDTTIPNTNWVRGRAAEGAATRFPLSGGNVNALTIGGLPVVRTLTAHQIYIGWSGGQVHAQVDNTYLGYLWHTGNFNPGNYWNVWNFDPNSKANYWDVNNLAGNKAWIWSTVHWFRMIHAGDGDSLGLGWNLNMREPFAGGIVTGAAAYYAINRVWALRLRYLQMQMLDGNWYTVGYA